MPITNSLLVVGRFHISAWTLGCLVEFWSQISKLVWMQGGVIIFYCVAIDYRERKSARRYPQIDCRLMLYIVQELVVQHRLPIFKQMNMPGLSSHFDNLISYVAMDAGELCDR